MDPASRQTVTAANASLPVVTRNLTPVVMRVDRQNNFVVLVVHIVSLNFSLNRHVYTAASGLLNQWYIIYLFHLRPEENPAKCILRNFAWVRYANRILVIS